MKKAIIFGAGEWGAIAHDLLKSEYNITAFYDNDEKKHYTFYCGKEVLPPPEKGFNHDKSTDIIITIFRPNDTVRQLKMAGITDNVHIFFWKEPHFSLFKPGNDDNNNRLIADFIYNIEKENSGCVPHFEIKNLYFKPVFNRINLNNKSIRILDVGCGTGQFANLLFDNGYLNYFGIDISGVAIECAKKVNYNHEDKFLTGSIFDIDKEYLQCEALVCLEVLEHIEKDIELLKFFDKGTKVFLSVPSFDSLNHIRTFQTADDVHERYNSVLRIVYCETVESEYGDFVHIVEGVII